MDTGSAQPAVGALLDDCRRWAREAFGGRLLSVYLIGSLAHGGFVPAVSDIDVALILADPPEPCDAERVAAIGRRVGASHPAYGSRLSLFWTSPGEFNRRDSPEVAGRFPALDRLDLICSGRLIGGIEARDRLQPPTRGATLAHSRDFLLDFARDPARYPVITGAAPPDLADRKALTRLCLFPARFLYTVATGEPGSNDAAADHYRARYGPPGAAIVALGMRLRREPEAPIAPDERALLTDSLPAYYRDFLCRFLTLLGGRIPPEGSSTAALLAGIERLPNPARCG